jgi:hypothetical protein
MMPGSIGIGFSSNAPPKYRMVYPPPGGQLHRPQQQQNWGNHPQFHPRQFQQEQPQQQQQFNRALFHHHSKLPSGHHNSFLPATFHASTAGRLATLLYNATNPSKATHREIRHPWSISRGAIKRVLHHRWAMPTIVLWRRFPREKKC